MNILVDIQHPAHFHLFKNFIREMKKKNNNVIVTLREKGNIQYLLKKENINFIKLGENKKGIISKFIALILYEIKLFFFLLNKKIDIGLGTSTPLAHVGKILRFKTLVFNEDDEEIVPFFSKITYPFADYIITPKCLNENHGKKHIQLDSLHELAYLHPDNFKPDKKILKELNVEEGEKFFILRFNAFKAHHDKGIKGISLQTKRKLIEVLSKEGKVFITTEGRMDREFEKYQIKIPPEEIHSALYYATMFIGDSQTMTAEAAVLGTPAIRCKRMATEKRKITK